MNKDVKIHILRRRRAKVAAIKGEPAVMDLPMTPEGVAGLVAADVLLGWLQGAQLAASDPEEWCIAKEYDNTEAAKAEEMRKAELLRVARDLQRSAGELVDLLERGGKV